MGNNMKEIKYKPIGIIHSPFKEPKGMPIQSAVAMDIEGTVEIFPEYAEGIESIEGFSHIILIYHFHLSKKAKLKVKPYMDDKLRGVFATRAPSRPNPIGLSTVKIVEIKGRKIHVKGLDIVDGTPLLDIKPYVPEFDVRDAKIGWLEENVHKLPLVKENGRFEKKVK